MKKKYLIGLFLLMLTALCSCLGLAGVSERATQQRYEASTGAFHTAVPDTDPAVMQDINIKIDAAAMSRPYNAKQIQYPVFTADVPEPRVEYFWYQKRGEQYVAIDAPPTFVGEYRVTVRVEDGMEYTGEDTVEFSITPAVFCPENAEFRYTGASVFSVEAVSAYGTDRIGYEVAFKSGDAGAEISYITLRGDRAENYSISPDFRASILPLVLDISQAKALSAQKSYDATELLFYTFDSTTLPGVLRGDSVTAVFSTGITDVCDATTLTASVLRSENPNYRLFGEVEIALRVTKAVFTPPAEIAYRGTKAITLDVPTGLGEDVLTLTLMFESEAVGAKLVSGGVTFAGEHADNYTLQEGYTAQIVPMLLDLSKMGVVQAQKRFDGTNVLCVSLSAEQLPGVAPGEILIFTGTVSQIYPCESVMEVLQITSLSNPNYRFENALTVCLTVKKALLVFSGAPALDYNGYSERILSADGAYVKGLVADRPVAVTAVFDSGAPGAAFRRIRIHGEYSELYEVDDTAFAPVIKTATLGFLVKSLSFASNGSDTRVLRVGESVFLSAAVQSDDVCVVLTFSSPDAGATLLRAELTGKDAYKYRLDITDFTAVIA